MIEGFYLLIQLWKYRKHQVQCLKRLKGIKALKKYRYDKPLVVSKSPMRYNRLQNTIRETLRKTKECNYNPTESRDRMWSSLGSLLSKHYGYEIEIKDNRQTFTIRTLEGVRPFDIKSYHVFGENCSRIDNIKIFAKEYEVTNAIREYCKMKYEERQSSK